MISGSPVYHLDSSLRNPETLPCLNVHNERIIHGRVRKEGFVELFTQSLERHFRPSEAGRARFGRLATSRAGGDTDKSKTVATYYSSGQVHSLSEKALPAGVSLVLLFLADPSPSKNPVLPGGKLGNMPIKVRQVLNRHADLELPHRFEIPLHPIDPKRDAINERRTSSSAWPALA